MRFWFTREVDEVGGDGGEGDGDGGEEVGEIFV